MLHSGTQVVQHSAGALADFCDTTSCPHTCEIQNMQVEKRREVRKD